MRKTFLLVFSCTLLWACKAKKQTSAAEPSPKNPINLCGPTKAELNTAPGKDGLLAPIFEGLDVYNYTVTTKSPLAQKYFNQGFILNYGFNHAEAARAFREAIKQDPTCAMCYWGLSYVLGPNYNAPMDPEVIAIALEAIANAKLNMQGITAKEEAIIMALTKRYPKDKEADPMPYNEAYAEAMKQVAASYPADIDIQVMTAEALLNIHPWDLCMSDKSPQPWTDEILAILETALDTDPSHPQATHLYIHAMEAGPNPEKGLFAADNLRLRVPGSGHLLHMPSHLYINTGDYHKGTIANELAIKKDSVYVESCHEAGIYPLIYYPHNWHFLAACTGLEGNGSRAVEASRYMADYVVDQAFLRAPGMALLQHFLTIPWFIQIKFGKWQDILNEPMPESDLLYPTAILHYTRGMAYANQGNIEMAQNELDAFKAISINAEVSEIAIFVNTAADIFNVAEHVLIGTMQREKGMFANSVKSYQTATDYEEALNYIEPPDWFFSVRHYLGDALLKNKEYKKAEKVYKQDLKRYKKNGWALMGLYQSLIGQNKEAEAIATKKLFDTAWLHADVELKSSVL